MSYEYHLGFSEAPDPKRYENSHRKLGKIVRTLWGLEIEGRDNLPDAGPYILAPNHRALFDPVISGVIANRALYFMAKKELWEERKFTWTGVDKFIERRGAFPVDRDGNDTESTRKALEIIKDGHALGMYPEGTAKNKGQKLSKLHEGVAWVAVMSAQNGIDCPVVTMGMTAEEIYKLGRVQAVVSEPLHADLRGQSTKAARKELTEQIGESLQVAVDRAYEIRRPRVPFLGLIAQLVRGR